MGSIVCLVFFLFYQLVFKDNPAFWIGWVILGIGIIISLPFCYLSSKYLPFACILCAIPAGISLSMVLQVAIIYMIKFEGTLYFTMGILSFLLVALSLMFKDHAINILNAISSSYVIMRCIGLIFNYPYEFVIYSEVQVFQTRENFVSNSYMSLSPIQISPYNYIYTGGFVLGVIISTLIKFKLRKSQITKNQHPYYVI